MKRIINILILLCCIASLSFFLWKKLYRRAQPCTEDIQRQITSMKMCLPNFPTGTSSRSGEDLRINLPGCSISTKSCSPKLSAGTRTSTSYAPRSTSSNVASQKPPLPIDRNFGPHTALDTPNVSPYIRHELNKTSQPERQTEDYAVPYMWGTAGIVLQQEVHYSRRRRARGISSGLPKNRSKILMKDSYRDAYGTAIIYAHVR